MKNLKDKIEAIPEKDFYTSGQTDVELEAYGDDNYIISMHIEEVRDE